MINNPDSLADKKILVTGAAGLIGSATVRELLDRGATVIGVDNMNDYYSPVLKSHRIEGLKGSPSFRFVRMDIDESASVNKLFLSEGPFDAVINLAARAGVRASLESPSIYLRTNAQGTLNLLEAMRKSETKKIILASTSSLYAGLPLPFTEDLPVNAPISPYAASKKAAEMMAYTYHYIYGLDVSILRYFTVYGRGGRPDMSPFRFIEWVYKDQPIQLFGDGSRGRDFTHVEDIARGTVAALKPLGYEVINLGGGNHPVPMSQLIHEISSALGKKPIIDYRPEVKADMDQTWADISKAEKLLSWKPEIPLKSGIRDAVDWHVTNRDLLDSLHWI